MTPAEPPGGSSVTCPSCGATGTGAFCQQCGAALAPRPCPACGAPLGPGARFCHRCGSPAAGTGAGAGAPRVRGGPGDRLPWIAALGIITVTVGLILWRVVGPDGPVPAGGGIGAAPPTAPGAAPDISQMTPIERFIRLNDRIMAAAEQGDSSTVRTFLPMALAAYDQLPEVDTDTRYHAALLRAEGREFAAAQALVDTILAGDRDNLIGLALVGTLAELTGDRAALDRARRQFLAAWAAEIAKPNPEYIDHREVLDAFRAGAGG